MVKDKYKLIIRANILSALFIPPFFVGLKALFTKSVDLDDYLFSEIGVLTAILFIWAYSWVKKVIMNNKLKSKRTTVHKKEILQQLRTLPTVWSPQEFTPAQCQQLENLIFDFESKYHPDDMDFNTYSRCQVFFEVLHRKNVGIHDAYHEMHDAVYFMEENLESKDLWIINLMMAQLHFLLKEKSEPAGGNHENHC